MTRLATLIDVQKCNGCYNCFLACRDEHYGNDYLPLSAAQPLEGQFWMQVKEVERGRYPRPKLSYIPVPCMQCEEAPCIAAAKDGAVYRREDGVVVIDPEMARGQEEIVNACPYRAIYWNAEKQLPQKCTLCAHRLDEGAKAPRCVESCPTGAMLFGDLDDPSSDIARAMAAPETEEFHPEFGTRPLVRYLGLPKRFVAGEVVLSDRQEECAAGVDILLTGEGENREIRSDSYGDFEFEGLLRNKTYKVTINKEGYLPYTKSITTRTDVNLGEILLTPSS